MSDKRVSDMSGAEIREMAGAASPADELRKAAKTLRELADAATPGPWRTTPGNKVSENVMTRGRLVIDGGGKSWPDGKAVVYGAALNADAEYIAGMHPGVALAVADWLDEVAADSHPSLPAWVEDAAVKIARAVLATVPDAESGEVPPDDETDLEREIRERLRDPRRNR